MKNRKLLWNLVCAGVLSAAFLGGCGKKDTSEQQAYRQYGINCMESGNYEEAISAFQKTLDLSVGGITNLEIDTCYYKAEAQYLFGDIEGAFETYNALIAYDELAKAYYLRGCLYFSTGEQEKGLSDLKCAAENAKDDYELYIALYETMAQYGKEAEGQVYLNQALAIKGEDQKDLLYKGRVYALLGESEKAISSLQSAVEKGELKANFYMAQIYAEQGNDSMAQTCFQAYLESGEATAEELCAMGELQMSNKDYDTAITYLKSALELEVVNNKQQVMKNLIIAYESSHNFKEAKAVMDNYLKEFPEDEDAKKEAKFLETR